MKENKRFKDRVVIVTGASRGLGKEIAMSFQREGAIVIGFARSEIAEEELPFNYHRVDIRSTENIQGFVDEVIRKYNKVDILIHNAAIPGDGGIYGVDEVQWDDVFDTNLKGPAFLTRSVVPYMKNGSSIIFISTRLADQVLPERLVYSVSKAALGMLAKSLAHELGEAGIRVNVIAPTIMATSFRNNDVYVEKNLEKIISETPLRKICTLGDVAEAAMFLSSEQAGFITGIVLPVDGGRSL
jgi:3-oxoacyl-[acyl-carrier protein] reductase